MHEALAEAARSASERDQVRGFALPPHTLPGERRERVEGAFRSPGGPNGQRESWGVGGCCAGVSGRGRLTDLTQSELGGASGVRTAEGVLREVARGASGVGKRATGATGRAIGAGAGVRADAGPPLGDRGASRVRKGGRGQAVTDATQKLQRDMQEEARPRPPHAWRRQALNSALVMREAVRKAHRAAQLAAHFGEERARGSVGGERGRKGWEGS